MQKRSEKVIRSYKPYYLVYMIFILLSIFPGVEQLDAREGSAVYQELPVPDADTSDINQEVQEVDTLQEEGMVTPSDDQGPAGGDQELSDEGVETERNVTANDVKRGERLFKGLVSPGPDAASCVSCHNTMPVDTFNWNPSAYEVAVLYRNSDVADLRAVVMEAMGGKMMEVHSGYELSEDDMFQLKAYMDELAAEEPADRPVITNSLIFIGLLVVLMGALADLIVLKTIPFKLVHLALILGSLYFIVDMVAFEAISVGRSPYYVPEQPVKFSHQVHAHDNQTDCQYCHSTVEYSQSAGIPSTSMCMNCHVIVREGSNSGRFEINKVVQAYENGTAIRWVKVYDLPDHAHFSHELHVGSSELDCAECHGDVEFMDRVSRVPDLSMGWCLECHRTTEVDILDNEFYSDYMELREDLKAGRIDIVTASETGGTDCMKCHY